MKRRDILAPHRIVILCEGDTEEHCVKHFLRRSLDAEGLKPVGLHPINLRGKLDDVRAYVPRYQRDERVIAAFTLVDLYGINRVTHAVTHTLDDKVVSVKSWLRDGLENYPEFFHPHVCVHEIEAWFLAEGEALRTRLKAHGLTASNNAEELNFLDPPKKRLNRLFKQYLHRPYEENGDGQPLFKALEHELVYERCRYYREFYDDLVSCARGGMPS